MNDRGVAIQLKILNDNVFEFILIHFDKLYAK